MYVQNLPWTVNWDEAAMPPYDLPELMKCQDGTPVTDKKTWEEKRRPELLALFREYFYGDDLPPVDKAEFVLLTEKKNALDGIATRREYLLRFSMNSGASFEFIMLLYIPNDGMAKHPVFAGLTFQGNHAISSEEDIQITGMKLPITKPEELQHGYAAERFPLQTILSRGYALATASYHDIFPDRLNGWYQSVYRLFFSIEELMERPVNYSSIGAWSWGISRMMDLLETLPEIDAERAAVYGHSRLGKTALWTGVRDPRFKLVCVNDSGCGGAALNRRLYGETLFSMCHRSRFNHWFVKKMADVSLHPEQIPVEQHELLALVAPRRVAVHSATLDQWADPKGEYLGAYYAGPAFSLYGKTPLASPEPPQPDTPVGSDVSYFYRTGKHNILLADWQAYLNVAP